MKEQPIERPISIMVFGILNIIFGVIGLCGIAFSAIMLATPEAFESNPATSVMFESRPYYLFMAVSSVLGALATIAILAAGIGLLLDKDWARKVSLAYAAYAVLIVIVSLVMQGVFVIPHMSETIDTSTPAGAGQFYGAIGGAVGGTCAGLIYPVFLAIWMTRPHVKAWLQYKSQTAL